jgi:peroxiredoxin Q/BCP
MQKVGAERESGMEHRAVWSGEAIIAGAMPVGDSVCDPSPLLAEGSVAPFFSLPTPDMDTFSLESALAEKVVILYFYPRDAMPSSIRQTISFSDHDQDFERLGAVVVGISMDDCMAHADFRDEHGIAIELLADPEGEVCRRYGVWQERLVNGMNRPTVLRSTFVIGNDGLVLLADYNIDVRSDHTARLLELLKSTSAGSKNGNRQERGGHA